MSRMETPRTCRRRDICQKRLQYFNANTEDSPRMKAHASNGVPSPAPSTSVELSTASKSQVQKELKQSAACTEEESISSHCYSSVQKNSASDVEESIFNTPLKRRDFDLNQIKDCFNLNEVLSFADDDVDDDVSELLTTHRPDYNSDFNPKLRESIAMAVRHSLNYEAVKPSFTVAENLEQLLGAKKFNRLMKNLEDIEDEEECRESVDAAPSSISEQKSLLDEFLRKSDEYQPNELQNHREINTTSSCQSVNDDCESKNEHLISNDAILLSDTSDVKCAFSAEEIYAEAQRINLEAVKKAYSHEPVNKPFLRETSLSANFDKSHIKEPFSFRNHELPSENSGTLSRGEQGMKMSVPYEGLNQSVNHMQFNPPTPEPAVSTTTPLSKEVPHRPEVFRPRLSPYGPIPKSTSSSVEHAGSSSVFDSTYIPLATKGKVPKFHGLPSMSFGDESVVENGLREESSSEASHNSHGSINEGPTLDKESCDRDERLSINTEDLPDDEGRSSSWIESVRSSRLTKESLMKYLDEVETDMRKSLESGKENDDLFTRVTSVLGDVKGIDFNFLKKEPVITEEKKNLLCAIPQAGGGVTPREGHSALKNAVKVCPECAEIADINEKYCEDCGFSLVDIKPVPSKKRLDKSTSIDCKVQQVSDSTDFVYDEAYCPLESLSRDVREQLSLNLRDSRDSNIPGDVYHPSEDISFEYLSEKHSLPPCIPNELSLNLSLDDSSTRNEVEESAVKIYIEESVADPGESFVQRLIVDPRFRPQSAENISSSLPKPSKKRPKSAQNATSRLYQSLNPDSYQRRWTSSGIRSSGDFSLKTRAQKTRPISAKVGDSKLSVKEKKPRPFNAGFSRALQSLSHEDLTQMKDAEEATAHPGRSLRKSQASPVSSGYLPEPPLTVKPLSKSHVFSSTRDDVDPLMSLPAANANYAKYFALGKSHRTKRLYARQSPRFAESCGVKMASNNHEDLLLMTPRVRAGDLSMMTCLPDEIVLFIFSYLGQAELGHCAVTCKQFNRIAMDTSLWHTIIVKKRIMHDDWLIQIGQRRPLGLSLIQCRGDNVSAQGLRTLFRECSESLKELNITGCHKGQLTGDHLLLHAASRCKYLTHLDASWCNINEHGFLAISDCSERLECVCINGCQSISDDALRSLVQKHGTHLNTLEMFGCFSITANALTEISQHCKGLLTLNMGQCWKLSDASISQLSASLGQVENLDLRGCKQVQDATVRQILLNCPRLRTLSIANIPDLTDEVLVSIASLCPSIRSLDLCGCTGLTNTGVKVLAQAADSLTYLDLSSSKSTNQSVSALANYCNSHLEVVKLNFCKNISSACLKKLAQNCKRLKKLYLYGVNGVRAHVLDELRLFNPNLWIEM